VNGETTIRVLHVDDEPGFGEMVAEFLEREDDRFAVSTETSASGGLNRLANGDEFDCIVSDFDMPGEDGIEFLEDVRDDHPDLPFILFTGKGSEQVASDAISAGATNYLQKSGGSDQYTVLANRVVNACERYRAEQELKATRETHETVLSNISDTVFITDDSGTFTYVCPNVHFVFGYSAEEVTELDSIDELFEERLFEQDELEAKGEIPNIETEIVDEAGERRTVLVTVKQVAIQDGTKLYSVRDISDRKERERELEASQARYRSLTEDVLDSSDVGTFILDSDFEIVWINEAVEEYFGLDRKAVIGVDKEELIETDIASIFEAPARFAEIVTTTYDDNTYVEEFECHVLAGEEREDRWLNHWSQPIEAGLYEGGRIEHYTDITEQKEQKAELERYQRIVEVLNDVATIVDPDGTITYASPSTKRVLGYEPEELIGEDQFGFESPETREAMADAIEYVLRNPGEIRTVQTRFRRLDGSWRWLESTMRNRLDDDMIDGILVNSRDVSERRRRRRQLQRQNERLEEFASIVSHDLQSPLDVAEGRLELAREECDTEHLAAASRAHDRMRALIAELLTLANEGELVADMESVGLAALARDCWQNVVTAEATLIADIDRTIDADPSRLRQLLANLFRNSVEHGSTGSRTPSGDSPEHGREAVTVTISEFADGFYVEDDGPGIPPDERDSVFDAGYSTAKDGTGYGLRIVERIAEAHGWTVRATEGSDGGARFEITDTEFADR
jgi:PAS domain S-box-containing protein